MQTLLDQLEGGVFRSAVDCNLDCVEVLDLDGRIQFINAAGLGLLRIADFASVKGRALASLWPEESGLDIGRAIAAARRGEHFRFEADVPIAGGSRIWCDAIVSPLSAVGGGVVGILLTIRDATASVINRLEGAARSRDANKAASVIRSANRLAQLGGWEYDCATRRVLFSDDLADLLGAQPQLGLDEAVQFWIEEDRPEFLRRLEAAAAFGREFTFEGRCKDQNGAVRWTRVIGEPELAQGWCVAMRGASQDITDWHESMERLRESEQAAIRASEAMSGFLTTMSHELRTPLNGMLGIAQVMALGVLTDEQKGHLEVLRNSGEMLLNLLNDLLDLSKVKAGKVELDDGVIDADDLAEGARAFAVLIGNKDVAFSVTLSPAARGPWKGDPARVRQVLHNLVGNAVKFTDQGSVAIDIECEGQALVLRVCDTGIGIPPDRLDDIFERFVQADSSMTRRYGGSGLGLAICKDLITLMGGDIAVESVQGAGTTFTVTLPLARMDAQADPASSPSVPSSSDESLRVLAAEDNPTNQVVLKALLSAIGIESVIVDNGQQAVDAWKAGNWDIVLMDIQMPEMDGVAAIKAIREIERRERRVRTPVIAVTANAMDHHRVEYLAAGMDDLVSKPINLQALIQSMELALARDDGMAQLAAGSLCGTPGAA